MRRMKALTSIAFVVAMVAGMASTASATQSPSGCGGSGLHVVPFGAAPDPPYFFGETLNIGALVGNNQLPNGCDITQLAVSIITPDAVVHPLLGEPTKLPAGSGGFYTSSVPYAISIADAPDGGCGTPRDCPGSFDAVIRVQGVLNDLPAADDPFTSDTHVTFSVTPAQPNFLCDVTKNGGIAPGNVPVVDQFGAMSARLGRMRRLCNPANINNDDPVGAATPTHLDGYPATIRKPPATHQKVVVFDRFGGRIETLGRPTNVLVPAAKSLVGPPPPLAAPDVDHFVCYRATAEQYQVGYGNTVDEFGAFGITAFRPVELCDPADVDNTEPGADAHTTHYSCWSVVLSPGDKFTQNSNVWINDEFQARQLTATKLSEICVPASKQVLP